jgi:tetratricopeptide (TPR) repeat protein
VGAKAMRRRSDDCPDHETIAEYLDGRLDETDRGWMAEHLSRCETCYFLFSEATQMRPAATGTAATRTSEPRARAAGHQTRPWPSRRVVWLSAGGFAAAATVALMIGGGVLPLVPSGAAELQALVAAVGTDRTIEPRLTGGFAYGPLRGGTRSGDSAAAHVSPDVQIAAAQIEKMAAGRRTPRVLNTLGIAYLVVGDVTRAVAVLEEAADQSDSDARILNDLAAAYLVRAARDGQAQDVARALTITDRVIVADPRLAEGWFNRASAFEQMFLFDEARRAWQEYLSLDSSSGWAAEARRRLEQLSQRRS